MSASTSSTKPSEQAVPVQEVRRSRRVSSLPQRYESSSASEGTPERPLPRKRPMNIQSKNTSQKRSRSLPSVPTSSRSGAVTTQAQREAYQQRIREDRKKNLKETVSKLTDEECRQLVEEFLGLSPGLIYIALDRMNQEPEPNPDPEPLVTEDWCSCNKCRDMPTDTENVCCGRLPHACYSIAPHMQALLDPFNLDLNIRYRRDWNPALEEWDDDEAEGLEAAAIEQKRFRYAAYRCWTLWHHGRLGQGDRRVIPSCVVRKIRSVYPDPNGRYKGFVLDDLI